MLIQGIFLNGVVVPQQPMSVPEGTQVTIEIAASEIDQHNHSMAPRQGGWWKDQVTIAPDFDELPDEIREAFGMNQR